MNRQVLPEGGEVDAGRRTVADEVYAEIEALIVEGDLSAGQRINENAIAERREISRGPVREACRKLEQAGLVEFRINRGFFVSSLELEDVLEIYEVRGALFAQAGRMLAERISSSQIATLEELNDQMEAALAADDSVLFYDLNRRFHSLTMIFTGNRKLASVYEALDRELHIWRKRALIKDGNVRASAQEHVMILDALRGGNPTACAQILQDHSLAGRNRLIRTMPDGQASSRAATPSGRRKAKDNDTA